MKNPVVAKAAQNSADPERSRYFFELMAAARGEPFMAQLSEVQAAVFAALFSGSQALSNQLLAHPEWFGVLNPDALQFPRREQGLRKEVGEWLPGLIQSRDYAGALTRLRKFKQKEMLRIAARDLSRRGGISEITREISDVADVCLGGVWQVCAERIAERFGNPWHRDADGRWRPTAFCLLGMGKLGGQELNYSSDVDVLFLYGDEGEVFREPPGSGKANKPVLANHAYFNRFAESFIEEVSRMGAEGMLFRIDLRLRPEGESGPLTRSLAGYENYYAQWGQTWERMMLIKTRRVAGDEGLGAEFLEMIQPFRYPRTIQPSVLHEIGAMKDRIETEVLREGELDRNVKLGRGGIREIEFLAQAQQLLHAGRQPFLQTAQTLPCLEKLAQYGLIATEDAVALEQAYSFLRDVEHRLQMEENLQTHTISGPGPALLRLARLMGLNSEKDFEAVRQKHTSRVRRTFAGLFKSEQPEAPSDALPPDFEGSAEAWKILLAEYSFVNVDTAFRLLREFVHGPGYVHVSQRTVNFARNLLSRLLALCPRRGTSAGVPAQKGKPRTVLSDPDR
ncbi:MAG TPA: hypothetical protein VFD66_13860, partial [Verrucomicrobiae bacterium]|nr:hypothetical protein [Verrucomicrobiae bacterium]